LRPLALARAIARLALTKKAENVVLLDLRGLTSMADYFVVCSADSDIQVNAIARAVEEGMESEGVSAWHSEKGSGNWVLLDYVDVVLHIFHKHARQFYSLEKLWGDAKITAVAEEAPAPTARKKPARKPVRAKRTATRKPAGKTKRTAAR
jgi:ribosome-associated protein